MADEQEDERDITIVAIPPKDDMDDLQRRRMAEGVVDMLRRQGFRCTMVVPDDE
jgi:hypothetical protein